MSIPLDNGLNIKLESNKKTRRGLRKFFKIFFICIACFAFVGVAWAYTYMRTVPPPEIPPLPTFAEIEPMPNSEEPVIAFGDEEDEEEENWMAAIELVAPERFTDEDRKELFFTFLIVGLNEGRNANTVMVASYDGVTGEANLISIPRDSLLNVNRNFRKLSGSYLVGLLSGCGITQVQRDVMTVIGFVPDFYVVIDYEAFFAIVDAVGGVEIYVPFHMRNDDPYQDLFIDIQPGLHHMDSEMALLFARFRESNPGYRPITDYDRIENQQTVVNAVIDNLFRPSNILRIPDFINIFNESVDTNLTVQNMVWFASQLPNLNGSEALSSYTMPTDGNSGRPMWYEFLHGPAIVELVNKTVNPFERDIELRDLDIIRN